MTDEQTTAVEYVPINSIKPNDYNPNRQSEWEFELLCRSMEEDGFTQPILVQQETMEIVDGEHRWRAAKALGQTEIPVVFTDMDDVRMRVATLRHNRARGNEDVQLASEVLRDLQDAGAEDWAADSLMLDPIEIEMLTRDITHPSLKRPEGTKLSHDALEEFLASEREQVRATKAQDKEFINREYKVFTLRLLFSPQEGIIIERVLGRNKARKVLELVDKYGSTS